MGSVTKPAAAAAATAARAATTGSSGIHVAKARSSKKDSDGEEPQVKKKRKSV